MPGQAVPPSPPMLIAYQGADAFGDALGATTVYEAPERLAELRREGTENPGAVPRW